MQIAQGMPQPWASIAAGKQRQRLDRIRPEWRLDLSKYEDLKNVMEVPRVCGLLEPAEIQITSSYDAFTLTQKMKDGVWSAEKTNCLTEIMFEEAIATASKMDQHRKENPHEPLPPLWGLPVSLKDTFKIPGYDASIGFVAFANRPSNTHSALLLLLQDLGAVIHCKTNVPQTLMAADTNNNVFGRTTNPYGTHMTAGGSSGGEGALVAMRGSLIGVGTDIAGSIRIPAVSTGIYGFKPTTSIIPFGGQESPVLPGIPGILTCAGPMTTSIQDCTMFMRSVLEASPWKYDATALHIPWTDWKPTKRQPLRIGLVEDNGIHTPSPPMRRALRQSVDRLKAAGHVIIPMEMTGVLEMVQQCWTMYALNGSQDTLDFINLSGEPMAPAVEKIGLMGQVPKVTSEMIALLSRRAEAQSRMSRLWTEYGVDVLLTPSSAHTAVPHDTWLSVTYTALYNYLDWPCTVLPVGKVDQDDIADDGAKYGAEDEAVYNLYTGPDEYAGMPTTVQLVGQPHQDEKLAFYSTEIDRIIHAADDVDNRI